MDEVVKRYEHANDLVKVGKVEEAVAEYRAGLAILERAGGAALQQRQGYFLQKLAQILWKAGRYAESKVYYERMGEKMPKPPSDCKSFKSGLKALQKEGLLTDVTPKELKRLLAELGMEVEDADEELSLVQFLQVYYAQGVEEHGHVTPQAVRDGFLHHDWRFGQETDDVIAELCQLLGQNPYHQTGMHDEARTDVVGTRSFIDVEGADGQKHSIEIGSLDDVVAFFNAHLERVGDKRKFAPINTDGDWHAYYLVDSARHKAIFGGKSPVLELDEESEL